MEQWLDITRYPGYQVSDLGNVRSFYHSIGYGGGAYLDINAPPRVLSQTPVGGAGHLRVYLYVNGKKHALLVHRIVAEAFIPNPDNYPVVRHLNDDPRDNRVCNLAWRTQRDNIHDCMVNKGMNYEGLIKYNNDRKTPIIAIDLESGKQSVFESQSKAARELNISQGNLWTALRDNRPFKGYLFKYSKEGSYV